MSESPADGWFLACSADEVQPGHSRRVDVRPPIALFNVGGVVYATDDTCTHAESSLSEGYLEPDGTVECVAHMAVFCVRTGAVRVPPASVPLRTYPVEVRDGQVWIDVSSR